MVKLSLSRNTRLDADETWEEEGLGHPPSESADYLERNRSSWHRWAATSTATGAKTWQTDEFLWGLWNTPESQLGLLRALAPGSDVIELGCGAGGVCAWLRRGGMHPVGVDFSPPQLLAAERLQQDFSVYFPLVSANAEAVPFDRESFDLAISEYGPSVWSDPRKWLPEAHRLLRLGGQLIFFTNSALLMACTPRNGSAAGEMLVRDYFSSYRVEFGEEAGVEFHPTHGQWVRLLRAHGFAVDNLVELRPRGDAKPRYEFVGLEWARRWPSEEIWVARKVSERPPDLGFDTRS